MLKRLDAITLANEEDALLPGSPLKAHPSARDRKRARHKGSRHGDGRHGRAGTSNASVASGSSAGRRRDRTPRAPSRRSTRETAGKAPPNEYPSERDAPQHEREDEKDAASRDAAARAREPWYARPRVLGEIIPAHTVDRVRGYLDRMAEKDDFSYVSRAHPCPGSRGHLPR